MVTNYIINKTFCTIKIFNITLTYIQLDDIYLKCIVNLLIVLYKMNSL